MAFYLGPGPVFKFECLTASRRWQHFAGRVLCIGLLLAALTWVARDVASHASGPIGLRELASAGEKFYLAITITQLSLLLLLAPAVAADSICLDKARGSLLTLLTTDLSSREIVLGKLLSRYLSIVAYVACGLPVLAICFSLGGISPEAAFGTFLVSLGVALVGGALALALSVWCTKTYEVLLVAYILTLLYLLLMPIARIQQVGSSLGFLGRPPVINWLEDSNPFFVSLEPYLNPGSARITHFFHFFFGCLVLSLILILFAIRSLRPVVVRHGSAAPRRQRRVRHWRSFIHSLIPGPSLDDNPVLWREWQRRQPSRWIRMVWYTYVVVGGAFSAYAIWLSLFNHGVREIQPFVTAFLLSIGLLIVSITSVTSLQEERLRGSLDVLLTTPLSNLQIYWGKWWGGFQTVALLAVLPTLVAAAPLISSVAGIRSLTDQPRAPFDFLLMPIVAFCYGGATVSLGLGLAIMIRQGGRAMAAAVIGYVAVTVGLLLTPLLLHTESYSCLGSSFMAGGYITVQSEQGNSFNGNFLLGILAWCVVYVIAGALFTFLGCRAVDRCLGRMPDTVERRM